MKCRSLLLMALLYSSLLNAQTRGLALTAEQNRELGECELQIDNLESAIEMAESDYKDAIRELRAGLFCSDCNRPKSEIERAEHVSFDKHIKDGGPSRKVIQAPQVAYDQVNSKYKSKIDGYKSRLASQRKQCERMLENFRDQAKRQQEKEDRERQDALNKQLSDAAAKQQQAKDDALRKQREQKARDDEYARQLAAYKAEQERQRRENIENLRSNIAGSMTSFNDESRANNDRKVQKLSKDKDWIENNNLGTNQQLQQQQTARNRAQDKWNEMNSSTGDMYRTVQSKTTNAGKQLQQSGHSIAQNLNQKYEEAAAWLNEWHIKTKEACGGNCWTVPGKVVKYTRRGFSTVTKDYLKVATWPVSSPFTVVKKNGFQLVDDVGNMLGGFSNILDDDESLESVDVIGNFRKTFARSLPFGNSFEKLNRWLPQ